MTGILRATPLGTQVAIVQALIAARYPKIELPSIASRFNLTLAEVRTIVEHYGYPDSQLMRIRVQRSRDTTNDAQLALVDESGAVFTTVDLAQLRSDPANPREHLTDIDELADSIKSTGLLQPIVVRRAADHFQIVAGHRRAAAARRLGWTSIEAIIRPIPADDVLVAMVVENNQRANLDPIEEARGLAALKTKHELTDAQVAARVGRSQPFVSGRLALLSLTAGQQASVRAGNMTLTEATHKGRQRAGTHGPTGLDRNWHLGPTHPLAQIVATRCRRAGHPRGRTVGGMGCGACWEHVIRTDERHHLEQLEQKDARR